MYARNRPAITHCPDNGNPSFLNKANLPDREGSVTQPKQMHEIRFALKDFLAQTSVNVRSCQEKGRLTQDYVAQTTPKQPSIFLGEIGEPADRGNTNFVVFVNTARTLNGPESKLIGKALVETVASHGLINISSGISRASRISVPRHHQDSDRRLWVLWRLGLCLNRPWPSVGLPAL